MNLEFDEIEAFIQFFLAEKQWRHSLLVKFGKQVFRDFERASFQDSVQQPNLRRTKKPKDLK